MSIPPDELEAALAARRGSTRSWSVSAARSTGGSKSGSRKQRGGRSVSRPEKDRQFAMAIVSLIACIPLTAISLGAGGLSALLVVWAGVVLLNIAFARMR